MNAIEAFANGQVSTGPDTPSCHLSPASLPVACTPGIDAARAFYLAEMTGKATAAAAAHWAKVAFQHGIRVQRGYHTVDAAPGETNYSGNLHDLTVNQLAALFG